MKQRIVEFSRYADLGIENIEKIDKEQRIVYFDGDQNCLISRSKMKGLKERIK